MRHQSVGLCLLCLFACNSLFGTAGAVVLCLHSHDSGHILSGSEIEACCHHNDADHGYSDRGVSGPECTQCTDIVLQGAPVLPLQQPDNATVKAPEVLISGAWLPNAAYRPNFERDALFDSRGSFEIAPLGVMLKQAVVWLL